MAKAEEGRIAAVRQLVASLNHEFNNRVSVVLSLTDWLERRRGRDDPELSEKLDQIRANARRISSLLHQLANMERLVTTDYVQGVKMLDIAGGLAGLDSREEATGHGEPADAASTPPPDNSLP